MTLTSLPSQYVALGIHSSFVVGLFCTLFFTEGDRISAAVSSKEPEVCERSVNVRPGER